MTLFFNCIGILTRSWLPLRLDISGKSQICRGFVCSRACPNLFFSAKFCDVSWIVLRSHSDLIIKALVSYLNSLHASAEPLWTLNPATVRFSIINQGSSFEIMKIHRDLNSTAHILATQTRNDDSRSSPCFSCNHFSHRHHCPVSQAFFLLYPGALLSS